MEEQEQEEFYFRGGKEFKKLIENVREDWVEKYGFEIPTINITKIIAAKIEKAGGIII